MANVKQIKIKVHSPKWCIIFFIGSGPNSSKYIFNEIVDKGQRHKIKTITLKYFINLI